MQITERCVRLIHKQFIIWNKCDTYHKDFTCVTITQFRRDRRCRSLGWPDQHWLGTRSKPWFSLINSKYELMQFVFACSPLKGHLRKKPMGWKLYVISPSPQKSRVCTLKTNQQRHCQTPHLSHFSMLLTQANWPIWNRPINKMMRTAQHCEGELGPRLYVCYTTAVWKLSLWF